MLKMVIVGSDGKMGRMLFDCAAKRPKDFQVVGRVDIGDIIKSVIGQTDVVIDFSSHTATPELVEICANNQKALVIGTTGQTEDEFSEISTFVETIPIVMASNFSVGINVQFWLTRKTAELLGPGFDLEIVEMHHRLKQDAPSGTAKRLLEILSEVRSRQVGCNQHARFGRSGNVGKRDRLEIGVHSLRGGDVVGDHTVIFADDGERVELTHKASSRETFAKGALHAAQWVVGQKPGLYSMEHVLGLI